MTFQSQVARPQTVRSQVQPQAGRSLQRKCACGGTPGPTGECEECRKKREVGHTQHITQTKLAIGNPGDTYEQEADRVADAVLRIAIPKMGSEKKTHFGPLVQRQVSEGGLMQAPPIVGEVLQSPGQPLEPATRTFMEPRFGYDFSRVQVHTDTRAAESARAVNARAYTVGRDIVFGSGQYAPETSRGRQLLAHELIHVVQQNIVDNPVSNTWQITNQNSPQELEAGRLSHQAESGEARIAARNGGAVVARAVDELEDEPRLLEPREEDPCAGYERDPQSMAWSIVRELVVKGLGRTPSGPLIEDVKCSTGREPVMCEGSLGNGESFTVFYYPSKNEANGSIKRGKKFLVTCAMSYSCPETWKIAFHMRGCEKF
jgi:Domain of unknown function (DUF4157)